MSLPTFDDEPRPPGCGRCRGTGEVLTTDDNGYTWPDWCDCSLGFWRAEREDILVEWRIEAKGAAHEEV